MTTHPLMDSRIAPFIVVSPDAHWMWGGGVDRKGYGYWWNGIRTVRAHRLTWEMMNGAIPTDKQIDHLCRVRSCVNPAHMEVVTCRENVLRGIGHTAVNARRTHCIVGHPFDEENTRPHKGRWRVCRACHLARWHKQKAAVNLRRRKTDRKSPRCAPQKEAR